MITVAPASALATAPRRLATASGRARVLFLNDTSRNGGPGRSLAVLLAGLDSRRFEKLVLLPREGEVSALLREAGTADDLSFDADLAENPFAPLGPRAMERADHDAPWWKKSLRAAGNAARMTRAVVSLARRIRRERIDLIYCNGTTANFIGALAAQAAQVPVLWHCRYTSLAPLLRGPHRWLSSSRQVRRIVCVSTAASGLFAHCRDKVAVVPNAVELSRWQPGTVKPCLRSELGLSSDVLIFGAHGRVLRRKGFLELLSAAHDFLRPLSRSERRLCHFVIVGDTPADFAEDHLAVCRARAADLGIADAVSFLGFRADPRPYVADFDVAVVPSVYPDPLPRAVLESMALGKPVIAFAVGGVPEMLTDDREGMLLPGAPPDLIALRDAFERYRRHPDVRVRHGAAARHRVETDFGAAIHAERISAEIAAALRGGRLTSLA